MIAAQPASKPQSFFNKKQIKMIKLGPVANALAKNFAGSIAVKK